MLPPRYDDQNAIEAVESRHHERHLSHARALKSGARGASTLSRAIAWLSSLRPNLTQRPTPAIGKHELTDYVCRLDDGSMGRVAIRESGGEWIAVCVKPA